MTVRKGVHAPVDRHSPAERLIKLGLAMSESRGGMTLDEMAQTLDISRRTAERLRNTLDQITGGGLTVVTDDEGRKRWSLPKGRFGAFTTPTRDELAELRLAARRLRKLGALEEADRLDQLSVKLESVLPRPILRRYEPDIESILEADGILVRPGPRIRLDPAVRSKLREAILESRQVKLAYRRRDTRELSRPRLHPYGLLSGARGYLVAFHTHPAIQDFRIYALSNIERIELLDTPFTRDPAFDLQRFAARSFGAFWDGETFDVAWRFKPNAAADARRFHFHPDQVVVDQPDGSVIVSFRASGLTEMAWHLFTWGDSVEILKPEALKTRYRQWLNEGLRAT
jgi:predicted DNA-binding transcriptional regulator YafY